MWGSYVRLVMDEALCIGTKLYRSVHGERDPLMTCFDLEFNSDSNNLWMKYEIVLSLHRDITSTHQQPSITNIRKPDFNSVIFQFHSRDLTFIAPFGKNPTVPDYN